MVIEQQLYEGIELDHGRQVGLITYMRTDSTKLEAEAVAEARRVIQKRFGDAYVPEKPPKYRSPTRRAQEAHEAIRPTSAAREPGTIEKFLTPDQFNLYSIIWKRFIASQMKPAEYDTLTIEVDGRSAEHNYFLRIAASKLRFPGFLELDDDREAENNNKNGRELLKIQLDQLPDLTNGDPLDLQDLFPEQHFTQPPRRFSDATLVRALEEHGIGRPSTYAPIISTIQQRGYVQRQKRRLMPTEIGEIVNDLIVEHFPNIVDLGFTARLEENLDEIAEGKREWVDVIRAFYEPFAEQVKRAEELMPEVKAEPEQIDRNCPDCGNPLVIRHGRFGKFIGCSDFPTCRFTEPWLEKIGVQCPEDGGELVQRRTRKGRIFFGCANYPTCDFTSWKRPLSQPCPVCKGLLVVDNKDHALCLKCGSGVERVELPSVTKDTV